MSQNAVKDCSIDQIISTLEDLVENQFGENSWLPESNKYKKDIIKGIKDDSKNNSIKNSDLKEYTTVSSILHCTDGWTFLSRAFKSIISGDIPSAMFFIYYSELRALMSLFGVNGISILNNDHYYFNTTGDTKKTEKSGTHVIVRKILDEYIKNGTKSTSLLKWIKVGNYSIEEWLRATGHNSTYIMAEFLSQWGLDISEIKADHDTRNEVSYRPHQLESTEYKYSYKEYLEQILDFWRLCEPNGSSGFNYLDHYILKKSLKSTFDNLPFGEEEQSNKNRCMDASYISDFKEYIKRANENLGSPLLPSQIDNLTSFDTPFDKFLEQASYKAYNVDNNQYDLIPMLARALFLLRFSTAGVNYIFSSVQLKKENIEFWWKEYAAKYGFWNAEDQPDNFTDSLWPDIEEVINEIKEKASGGVIYDSPKSIEDFSLRETNCLTQLNKIPLWAFGI